MILNGCSAAAVLDDDDVIVRKFLKSVSQPEPHALLAESVVQVKHWLLRLRDALHMVVVNLVLAGALGILPNGTQTKPVRLPRNDVDIQCRRGSRVGEEKTEDRGEFKERGSHDVDNFRQN